MKDHDELTSAKFQHPHRLLHNDLVAGLGYESTAIVTECVAAFVDVGNNFRICGVASHGQVTH